MRKNTPDNSKKNSDPAANTIAASTVAKNMLPTNMLEDELDAEQSISFEAFRGLCAEVWKEKFLFFLGVLLLLVSTATVLLQPRVLGFVVDEGLVTKDWSKIVTFAWILFAIEVAKLLATSGNAYLFSVMGQKIMHRLRQKLFTRLEQVPISVYDQIPAGKLVTRVTNDISSVSELFASGFVSVIGNFLSVAAVIFGVFLLNPKLAAVALTIFPIMVIACIFFSGKLRIAYRNARSKLSALNAFIAECFMGMREIQLFGREQKRLDRFKLLNREYGGAQMGSVHVFAYFRPTITVCAGISMGLTMMYGGVLVSEDVIKVGVLVAFFTYVLSVYEPIGEITDKWNIFLSGMASAERIFSILRWKEEVALGDISYTAPSLPELKGEIEFKNVWFAYQGENWVLKDVSFRARAGQMLGIVGATGSGKTTIISLLLRFYEIQKGEILIDGRPIQQWDKRSLRASLGLIQQDVFLFSGSIEDNITLWKNISADYSLNKSWIAEMTRLEDLSRPLLERGKNLSMGQRQVIAFARAKQAQPRVWILDEATANVDSNTEADMDKLLKKFAQGQTRVIIAHRLSTIRDADQILVLNRGVLIESGSHQALLSQKGLYARLYRFQEAEREHLSTELVEVQN